MINPSRRRVLAKAAAACAAVAVAPGVLSVRPSQGHLDGKPTTTHIVEIRQFTFHPKELRVAPGDHITWVNLDLVPHTATALDQSWDSGTLEKGDAGDLLVTEETSLDYYCRFHPMMKASLHLRLKE